MYFDAGKAKARVGGFCYHRGIDAVAKYSCLRSLVQPYEPYGGMDYELTGVDKGYYQNMDEGSVVSLLSNWTLAAH